MYREWVSPLDGSVLWHATSAGDAVSSTRVLPDGCIDLLWMDVGLFVAGPDTSARMVARAAGSTVAGLRFLPGAAPAVLGLPAVELTDLVVPLDEVLPERSVSAWAERMDAAAEPATELDEVTAVWRATRDGARSARFGSDLSALLRSGRRIDQLAADVGWSPRQLHRRCLDSFGYGAKTLARILRMQRALELARSGVGFATVAAQVGYADQPHMSREVRALTGATLGELVEAP